MATAKYRTIVAVLRDGSHVIHQSTDSMPGHASIRIGAHLAFCQRELGDDVENFVIIHGSTVTEHLPNS